MAEISTTAVIERLRSAINFAESGGRINAISLNCQSRALRHEVARGVIKSFPEQIIYFSLERLSSMDSMRGGYISTSSISRRLERRERQYLDLEDVAPDGIYKSDGSSKTIVLIDAVGSDLVESKFGGFHSLVDGFVSTLLSVAGVREGDLVVVLGAFGKVQPRDMPGFVWSNINVSNISNAELPKLASLFWGEDSKIQVERTGVDISNSTSEAARRNMASALRKLALDLNKELAKENVDVRIVHYFDLYADALKNFELINGVYLSAYGDAIGKYFLRDPDSFPDIVSDLLESFLKLHKKLLLSFDDVSKFDDFLIQTGKMPVAPQELMDDYIQSMKMNAEVVSDDVLKVAEGVQDLPEELDKDLPRRTSLIISFIREMWRVIGYAPQAVKNIAALERIAKATSTFVAWIQKNWSAIAALFGNLS